MLSHHLHLSICAVCSAPLSISGIQACISALDITFSRAIRVYLPFFLAIQVGFPGGRMQRSDGGSEMRTVQREVEEELGLVIGERPTQVQFRLPTPVLVPSLEPSDRITTRTARMERFTTLSRPSESIIFRSVSNNQPHQEQRQRHRDAAPIPPFRYLFSLDDYFVGPLTLRDSPLAICTLGTFIFWDRILFFQPFS
jgi:8-oxo-dGTP pyrophosphatase MutT (NUDIX family)